MPGLEHIVRLGTHAERDYLSRTAEWYDALAVNANLVEATRAATAALVVTLAKPFYLDPVTYAFFLDPQLLHADRPNTDGTPRVKSTFTALAAAYALPLGDQLGSRPLKPDELVAEGILRRYVDAVLTYQRTVLPEALAVNADFLTAEGDVGLLAEPTRLIPPYAVEDGNSEIGDLNEEVLKMARQIVDPAILSPMLAYDSRGADRAAVLSLAEAHAWAEQTWLWPTDLDEHNSGQADLNLYADLVRALGELGGHPAAAYGGYFAMLLAYRGMRAVTHGVGYGDKRDLEPVLGGGQPPPRFYFRPIRDGIGMGDLAVGLVGVSQEQFLAQVCHCTICRGLLTRGGVEHLITAFNETEPRMSPRRGVIEVPTSRVYRMSRFHYLENRRFEVEEVAQSSSWSDLAAELQTQAAWAAERFGRRAVSHINRWIEAARPDRT